MKLLAEMSKKDIGFICVALLYILYNIFPLFVDLTNIPIAVPSICICVYIVFGYSKFIFSKPVVCFLIFIVILILYGLFGHIIHINGTDLGLPWLWRVVIEIAWILPALLIMTILVKLNNSTLYKIVGYGSLTLLVLSFIYVLPLLITSVGYLRDEATMNISVVKPLGLPNYTLLHAYTFALFPILGITQQVKGTNKKWLIFLSLFYSYVIIHTTITTSLFVLVSVFVFFLIYNPHYPAVSFFKFCLFILIVLILYYSGIILYIVDELTIYFEGTGVDSKLIDIHNSLIEGQLTGDNITGRIDVQQISKDHFYENPFIGTGYPGCHSQIWDVLGTMGLVGGAPFLLMIFFSIKLWCAVMKTAEDQFLMICTFISPLIYLYVKGIFGAEGWLFMLVIAPTILAAFTHKVKNIEKDEDCPD